MLGSRGTYLALATRTARLLAVVQPATVAPNGVLLGGSARLCVEVRVEDAYLGDLVDRQRIAQGGLADGLGTRRVVNAERAGLVLTDERADPDDALLGRCARLPRGRVQPRPHHPGSATPPERCAARCNAACRSSLVAGSAACQRNYGNAQPARVGRVPHVGIAGYLSWLGEPEPHGFCAGLAASADIELAEDRRDMMIDRLAGKEHPVGNVGAAQALREERERLEFAGRQARGIVLGHQAGTMTWPLTRRARADCG